MTDVVDVLDVTDDVRCGWSDTWVPGVRTWAADPAVPAPRGPLGPVRPAPALYEIVLAAPCRPRRVLRRLGGAGVVVAMTAAVLGGLGQLTVGIGSSGARAPLSVTAEGRTLPAVLAAHASSTLMHLLPPGATAPTPLAGGSPSDAATAGAAPRTTAVQFGDHDRLVTVAVAVARVAGVAPTHDTVRAASSTPSGTTSACSASVDAVRVDGLKVSVTQWCDTGRGGAASTRAARGSSPLTAHQLEQIALAADWSR